ncbi:MAG TPA: preprotein translocase subunit SecG [Candidatus Saccharimonadales bacterium]|nr:preprotein translocase subunit SecG [Candidatus Saccharimonadales bacterium]
MFLLSLLTSLYGFLCCLIILIVLYQRGKGNMGLGNTGGGNQALFGSSGGQDVFQKTTWIFCALLLAGSLFLSVAKGRESIAKGRYASRSHHPMPNNQYPMPDEF